MGYTTEFVGKFNLDKELDDDTYKFLVGLANTRRMKRDPKKLEELGYGKAEDFGIDGEFYIGDDRYNCPSVLDHNCPPITQPGLWLQWVPTEDKKSIVWDGNEKFYEADKWIIYLIDKILKPRGYVVNGAVNAQGEDPSDKWNISISSNKVSVGRGFNRDVINFSLDLKHTNENDEEAARLYKIINEIEIMNKTLEKYCHIDILPEGEDYHVHYMSDKIYLLIVDYDKETEVVNSINLISSSWEDEECENFETILWLNKIPDKNDLKYLFVFLKNLLKIDKKISIDSKECCPICNSKMIKQENAWYFFQCESRCYSISRGYNSNGDYEYSYYIFDHAFSYFKDDLSVRKTQTKNSVKKMIEYYRKNDRYITEILTK